MKEETVLWGVAFLAILMGFCLGSIANRFFWDSDLEASWAAKKLVRECESGLPRNENCIIIAVHEKIK